MFLNFFEFFFCPQKVEKKTPSKVAQNSSNLLFSPIALTTQKVQTEEFLFQNVAYWLTVYRTAVTALYTNLLVIKCLLSWKWHPRSSHIRTPNYLLYNKVGFFFWGRVGIWGRNLHEVANTAFYRNILLAEILSLSWIY